MSPDTLMELCLFEIAKEMSAFLDELSLIPRSAKTQLLRLASRRDSVLEDIRILSSLVHPEIRAIDFINCTPNDQMLQTIFICTQLESLNLKGSEFITKEVLMELFPKLPNLKVLHFLSCSIIDDDVLEVIAKSCPLLFILDISGSGISSESLKNITTLSLKALNIKGFYITDEGINDFLSGICKDVIEEFLFTDCSDDSYNSIIQNCENLNTIVATKIIGCHTLAVLQSVPYICLNKRKKKMKKSGN